MSRPLYIVSGTHAALLEAATEGVDELEVTREDERPFGRGGLATGEGQRGEDQEGLVVQRGLEGARRALEAATHVGRHRDLGLGLRGQRDGRAVTGDGDSTL